MQTFGLGFIGVMSTMMITKNDIITSAILIENDVDQPGVHPICVMHLDPKNTGNNIFL